MTTIVAYPSIETINLDSKKIWKGTNDDDFDNHKFYFEEKVDGSQLSIRIDNGQLTFYNKHKLANHSSLAFSKSITMLICKYQNKNILNSNCVYHGESICNIKHNVNVYNRTPKCYFILYDIYDLINKKYLSLEDKHNECDRVGLEYVKVIYHNMDPDCNPYEKASEIIMEIEKGTIQSCLGGIPEGIVLKHHAFIYKGKTIATKLKYVTDAFKERHQNKQIKIHQSTDEFLEQLGKEFCVHARFQKAYQHLTEENKINCNSDSDFNNNISKIINELDVDFDKEYKEEIMMLLWTEFSPIIKKNARNGVGLWYKNNFLNNNLPNKKVD